MLIPMAAVQSQSRPDENSREEAKVVSMKPGAMPANSRLAGQGNQRRALGDIGNLVGALSTRCNVKMEGIAENPAGSKPVQKVMHPMTRRSAVAAAGVSQSNASVAAREVVKVADGVAWGAKQRRTGGGVKAREASTNSGAALLPPLPASTAVVAKGRPNASSHTTGTRATNLPSQAVHASVVAIGRVGKKDLTLTATLTARSEAACGGFDAEMVEAEPLPNIDEADVGNQLAVVDYVEDIYSFYRKAEVQYLLAPDYIQRQSDINEKMRAILVDWLIEVHLKFKLMPETLFLTTNLIDRFLAEENVSRKNLQLVGMTAMLLAAKYEEIFAPEVNDFVFISDEAYSREQVLAMEKLMLNTLHFNLTVPTPYVFIVRYLKAASSDKQLDQVSFFLVELCLVEYSMLKYAPSQLAAAAVYTAHRTLKRSPCWTPVLQRHSGYHEHQLTDCSAKMAIFHKNASQGNLTVVHRKYSSPRYNAVANLSPVCQDS